MNPAWADEIEPTHVGPAGRAWKGEWETTPDEREGVTDLGTFIMHAPGSHPLWSWYALLGISLRDVPGQPPASKQFAGATHELIVFSLHPDHEPPRPRGKLAESGTLHHLEPPDHVIQVMHVNDEQFAEILDLVAQAVVKGALVPDSDYREAWKTSLARTVDHYRGLHGA